MAKSQVILALLVVLCATYVVGHSYVTKPTSRSNQRQSTTGCRGPNCLGPCDVSAANAKTPATTVARGASINIQWPRNNHAGGFIRFAWAPTSGSDVHANFDNGVQEIHCHEVGGCGPDNSKDPNGGDSGPADGSTRACQITLTVPLHLTDGTWTLQWAWFGGAFALGDYYSCVDYVISGGSTGSKLAPVFYGGDYTYPGQNKCKFFNTDRLHRCVNEPCNNPVYTLNQERSGPVYMVNSTQPSPVTTQSNIVTTKAATTKANTQTQTTGKQSLTTSRVNTPATTTTTTTSSSTGTVSSGVLTGSNPIDSELNCAGLKSVVSSSVITITEVDTWSNVFRMEIRVLLNEDVSNWMIQVLFPSDATESQVLEVYNSGKLRCTASSPVRHAMIAPADWANNLKAGEEMYLEIKATNTNMDKQFLRNNIQFKMFRS